MNFTHFRIPAVLCTIAALTLAGYSYAQQGDAAAAPQANDAAAEKATQVLQQVRQHLASAKAYEVEATIEARLSGQNAAPQSMKFNVAVERPSAQILVEPVDRGVGMLVANGESVKAFHSQGLGFSNVAQPDGLDETLDLLVYENPQRRVMATTMDAAGAISQGVASFPLLLSHSQAVEKLKEAAQSISYVEKAEMDGKQYHKLLFNFGQGAKFHMFISAGDKPVLHSVTADVPNGSMSMVYNWTFKDDLPDKRFTFNAPAFTLENLDGEKVKLSQHQGKDVVVLDFWATWCGPCVQAMPVIERVVEGLQEDGKNVALYAVNLQEGEDKINAFLEKQGISLPVLLDSNAEVAGKYWVTGIPQTVIIDKSGQVAMIHVGFGPGLEQTLQQELTTVLDEKPIITLDHTGHNH
jgi:peroxiredoxin